MRLLVACSNCKRQFDASALQAHDHFRCHCGMELKVPQPKAHDASVVRCSACGAPRKDGQSHCEFCDSDFTLHELDLHTICSGCMARISDRAKFCHHCSTPVLAEDLAGDPTSYHCPSCQQVKVLHSRKFEEHGISVLECPFCGGLWLSDASFEVLLERARKSKLYVASGTPNITPQRTNRRRRAEEALYRACPVCKKLMNRKNFGSKSGVIIDACGEHGMWFDAAELALILSWIQAGREEQAQRLLKEREAQAKRYEQVRKVVEPLDLSYETYQQQPIPIFELLDYLVGLFRR